MSTLRGRVSRHWRWLVAGVSVVLLFSLLTVGWAWRSASSSLDGARRQIAAEESLGCDLRPWRARTAPSVWHSYDGPAQFRRAVRYRGDLFVAGRGGLWRYTPDGVLAAQYRPGLELPATPVVDLAVATLQQSGQQTLYLLTEGEGVLAFDGSVFQSIRPRDAGLRQIHAMWPLSSGVLLLGTEQAGVLAFDGAKLSVFLPKWNGAQQQHGAVTALAGDESTLLIGTRENGLFVWQAGTLAAVTGLPDPRVLSLWNGSGNDGTALAGTPLGVTEIREGHAGRTMAPGRFAQAVARQGEDVWVGTTDEGLLRVSTARHSLPEPTSASEQPVRSFMTDGGALLAVSDTDIRRRTDKGWETVVRAPAAVLSDRNVSALLIEPGGRWWAGYFDQGLDRFDAGHDHPAHLLDDHLYCVNRIVASRDGRRVVAATANGLVLFDEAGRARQVLDKESGLISQQVSDVLVDKNRMVAATGAGLTIFDASGVHSIYAFHNLVNNHVYTLAEREDGGELLAGTLGGLSKLQHDVVQVSYTTGNSALKNNWITALVPMGKDWLVGTYGAGVMRLAADGGWQPFPELPKGLVVNPGAMTATARAVYVGTLGKGLWQFDIASQRWRSVEAAALPSANVTAVAAGGGRLWVGTDNGLVAVPEGSL